MTDRSGAGREGPALARWTREMRRSALQEMLSLTARPGLISLALGLPAPELFPAEAIGKALSRRIHDDPRALQYGPPEEGLRAFVARLMAKRGVRCDPERIFLTAGAQQGMALVSRLLLDAGSTVIVEEHGYTGFLQAIASSTPRLVTVPASPEEGIDLGAAERAMSAAPRPALLYAMADGHNPLGVSMPVESRRRLVDLARTHGVPILEDDAYGMISYGGDAPPCLRSFDEEWVFHLGSFSKTLAPALRTGWIVAPERFIEPLASLKEGSDINTGTLGQRAVAAFIETGGFEEHVGRLRAEYAGRREALLSALGETFPAGTRWSIPGAGFFTWVELPGDADAVRLLEACVEREGVAFLPGPAFTTPGAEPARSALRLNFSFSSPEVIRDGVVRIARTLEALAGSRTAGAEHA